MELTAVQGSTYTPIQLAVLVDGIEQQVSSVTSGLLTIDGVTIVLTPDTTINRMTGVITSSLTDVPGVFTGTGSLSTNTGTYIYPDDGLALRVLEASTEFGSLLLLETLTDFLVTETLDFILVEEP